MNIGFDLDNVFINTPPIIPRIVIKKLYGEKANGILKYRIPSYPEQIVRQFSHSPLLRQPIIQNIDFLKTLVNNRNQLYLISSRYGFLKKRTEQLISQHNFDKLFSHMYFNYHNEQPHVFKNRILHTLQLDRYVDDDLHLLKFVAVHNPKTKFYWLDPGKQYTGAQKNLFSIATLPDILK